MKSLIWMGNLSDQISVLHETVTASVSESFTISPDDENDKICKNYKILWVNDNCVYETRRGPLGNEQINEEPSAASSIFYPLSSHQIISVHCNYNIYGAISTNNQVFMWGHSEKGQCGCIEEFVQRPNLVSRLTDEFPSPSLVTVCHNGDRRCLLLSEQFFESFTPFLMFRFRLKQMTRFVLTAYTKMVGKFQ